MASKKTTPASGTAGGTIKGAPGRKTPAAQKANAKAVPIVIDPPKKTASAKTVKKPDVIEAKVVEPKPKPSEAKSEVASPPKSEDTKPSPKANPEPQQQQISRLGFVSTIAGGVIAGGIGYFVAEYTRTTPPQTDYSAAIAVISDENARTIDVLSARIAKLEAAESNVDQTEITALKQTYDAQSKKLADRLTKAEDLLNEAAAEMEGTRLRLAENVAQTGGEIGAATSELIAGLGAEIDDLKVQLAAQIASSDAIAESLSVASEKANAQIVAAQERANELSRKASDAAKNVDLTLQRERLLTAVEAGKAYAAQLGDIANNVSTDVPGALLDSADDGVASLPELQQKFPEAARRALKASVKAESGDGVGAKLAAFLKSQVGARSLEEKEGDDADAVLSRAEAALMRGELRAAVDLVRELPQEGITEITEWIRAAEKRLSVQMALENFFSNLASGN